MGDFGAWVKICEEIPRALTTIRAGYTSESGSVIIYGPLVVSVL